MTRGLPESLTARSSFVAGIRPERCELPVGNRLADNGRYPNQHSQSIEDSKTGTIGRHRNQRRQRKEDRQQALGLKKPEDFRLKTFSPILTESLVPAVFIT